MREVLNTVGIFFGYAVLAIFAQNAIFTRGLGVSRLVQLVGDDRTSSWWFALMLCVTQILVAPLAFFAGRLILAPMENRAPFRPLVYLCWWSAPRALRWSRAWASASAAAWAICWPSCW